jgi:hypothetical protein
VGTCSSAPGDDQVCLASATITRGSDDPDPDVAGSAPARRFFVSSFWMDRTEVTVRSYRSCVAASACTEPAEVSDLAYYRTTTTWRSRSSVSCTRRCGGIAPTPEGAFRPRPSGNARHVASRDGAIRGAKASGASAPTSPTAPRPPSRWLVPHGRQPRRHPRPRRQRRRSHERPRRHRHGLLGVRGGAELRSSPSTRRPRRGSVRIPRLLIPQRRPARSRVGDGGMHRLLPLRAKLRRLRRPGLSLRLKFPRSRGRVDYAALLLKRNSNSIGLT